MDRRIFLGALAGVFAMLVPARAQQVGRVWKIGYLATSTPERARDILAIVETGLRELGYVPAKDVLIESRVANGQVELLPELAGQLVEARVDVILAQVNQDIAAARQATNTIPIVMMIGVNPVGSGFIAPLSRPGGNITGMTFDATPDTTAKNLQLLKEIVPRANRIAVLWDTSFPGIDAYLRAVQASAARLGVRIRPVGVKDQNTVMAAVDTLSTVVDEAVLVFGSPLFVNRRVDIVTAINKKLLPAMYPFREFVQVGGLASYGVSLPALFARAPVFVDKIFRGARPADLPVEQPQKFELLINMKTARAQGISIPSSLLLRADEVIQ
jgi:putative ABC transport system substrate-binding protein